MVKERGTIVCETPLTVRLNFEPAGRPSSEYDRYYLMDKANKCVVCGQVNSVLRKNIVPHDYRRHFPAFLKVFRLESNYQCYILFLRSVLISGSQIP